jgi:hypothetical protein
MELIIILLIAVEVVIVLIREGPELSHKLAYPIISYVHDLLHPGENKLALEVVSEELPRLQEALEMTSHTNLLSGLSHRDNVGYGDERLV